MSGSAIIRMECGVRVSAGTISRPKFTADLEFGEDSVLSSAVPLPNYVLCLSDIGTGCDEPRISRGVLSAIP